MFPVSDAFDLALRELGIVGCATRVIVSVYALSPESPDGRMHSSAACGSQAPSSTSKVIVTSVVSPAGTTSGDTLTASPKRSSSSIVTVAVSVSMLNGAGPGNYASTTSNVSLASTLASSTMVISPVFSAT